MRTSLEFTGEEKFEVEKRRRFFLKKKKKLMQTVLLLYKQNKIKKSRTTISEVAEYFEIKAIACNYRKIRVEE